MASRIDVSASSFDPAQYVRLALRDVPEALTLAIKLLAVVPPSAPEGVRKAASRMRQRTLTLEQVWTEAASTTGSAQAKAAAELDTAWRALKDRLSAYASLPVEHYPHVERARELLGLLFPQGLAFLALDPENEWAQSQKRLDVMAVLRVEADVRALAGVVFVDEVRRAHRAYGEALHQPTAASATAQAAAAAAPLRALTRTAIGYAVQVIGMIYDDPDALVHVQRVPAALHQRQPRRQE
jgi:hypothetical protein